MTLDEAREILGLEPGFDPSTVRRAYMRAVRAHSPERDPEGFQRVRAAYDLIENIGADDDWEEEPDALEPCEHRPPPNSISADQFEAPGASPYEAAIRRAGWNDYLELMQRGARAQAASLAIELLTDQSVDALMPTPLLRHTLQLEGEGEEGLALKLFEALTKRSEIDGTAVTAFEFCFELWAAARDFRAVRSRLDPETRRWIAAHLAVEPWTDAVPSWAWLEEEYPSRFKDLIRARKLLVGNAPAIEAILSRRPFSTVGSWRETASRGAGSLWETLGWRGLGWALFTAAAALIRLAPGVHDSEPTTFQKMVRDAKQEKLRSRSEMLDESRCDVKGTLAGIEQARVEGDCSRWKTKVTEFRRCQRVQTIYDDFAFTVELESLERELNARCQ